MLVWFPIIYFGLLLAITLNICVYYLFMSVKREFAPIKKKEEESQQAQARLKGTMHEKVCADNEIMNQIVTLLQESQKAEKKKQSPKS